MNLNLQQLQDSLTAYFATQSDVALAYLFGSHATGRAGPLSDVDVAVLLTGRPSARVCFDRRLDIIGGLMSLLRTNDVDVVVLNQAPLALRYQVVRSGILVHCVDRQAAIRFRVETWNLYFDFKPILDHHRQVFFAKIRAGEMLSGYNPHRGAVARHQKLRADAARAADADV